ncbi:hypothetical protein [Actinomadura sp. 7K534]|uniref:hypothetical protein n=1 Tax=Actinomadura sp. 7K534 TaxID=2530366 RepID=UPI00104F7C8D|nr:hypothetical protein [Actinomadura sp. 7K534]TDB87544.1 hypothetical protein E1266_32625 [Actinomadura sp. 7K534]
MTDYPVALAAEDFVPVALTALGMAMLRHRHPLVPAAAALVVAGGFGKAAWKLIVALGGPDLPWLRGALFPLLAIGFTAFAYALSRESRRPPHPAVLVIPLLAALALSAVLRDTWPALLWTIVAVTVAAVLLARTAARAGDPLAATLFGLWLAGQYLLGPLAARAEQSIPLQWVEQSCNTLAQAAFAFAAWHLTRTTRTPAEQTEERAAA